MNSMIYGAKIQKVYRLLFTVYRFFQFLFLFLFLFSFFLLSLHNKIENEHAITENIVYRDSGSQTYV